MENAHVAAAVVPLPEKFKFAVMIQSETLEEDV